MAAAVIGPALALAGSSSGMLSARSRSSCGPLAVSYSLVKGLDVSAAKAMRIAPLRELIEGRVPHIQKAYVRCLPGLAPAWSIATSVPPVSPDSPWQVCVGHHR